MPLKLQAVDMGEGLDHDIHIQAGVLASTFALQAEDMGEGVCATVALQRR